MAIHKTTFVRARIEPALKINVDTILAELGIITTQAITRLYKRIAREHAWPLELKVPNAKTRKVFEQDVKRAKKRGLNRERLKTIISLLVQGNPLLPRYRDHPLIGNYKGHRECHIQPDWLRIYKREPGLLLR